ncbi:Centromere/kinetochore Zw10-domain-containing protein [Phlyctochytrium arcticum]|nr:Centromere/kinetochore Zw10-domain-containing protein [Phlyctochytrium arcticum]
MSAADLASRVQRVLSKSHQDPTPPSFLYNVYRDGGASHAPPVARNALQHVADTLERGVADVKYQLEAHLKSHIGEFREIIAKGLHMQHEVKDLTEATRALTLQMDDQETGINVRLAALLDEQSRLDSETKEVELVVQVTSHMSSLYQLVGKYDALIERFDYDEAFQTAHEISMLLVELPEWKDLPILEIIRDRCQVVQDDQQSRLEYIIAQALTVDAVDANTVHVTVHQNITAPGLGPEPVALSLALSCIYQAGREQQYLRPFLRMFKKLVLDSIIQDPAWEISSPPSDGDHYVILVLHKAANAPGWDEQQQGLLFQRIRQILDPLAKRLRLIGVDPRNIMKTMGGFCWDSVVPDIISNYLSKVVPDSVAELKAFEGIVQETCDFEECMTERGLTTATNTVLSKYVLQADKLFARKRGQRVAQQVRQILLRNDFAITHIDSSAVIPISEILGDGKADQLVEASSVPVTDETLMMQEMFVFPRCAISVKAKELVELAEKTLLEITTLDVTPEQSNCAVSMLMAVRDIFDLYRAIHPYFNAAKLESVPQLAMVFHNDCMYFAHELSAMGWRYSALLGLRGIFFGDLAVLFRDMANETYFKQIHLHWKVLSESLDQAEGFDVLEMDRYEQVQRCLKQVTLQLTQTANIWRGVLPEALYLRSIAELVDTVMARITHDILSLVDIAEDESHRLNTLIVRFINTVRVLFDNSYSATQSPPLPTDAQIHNLLSEYAKLEQIADILQLPFADIMERFRSGVLIRVFSERELVGLVMALFADTWLRQQNLAEIREGYEQRSERGL